MLEFYKKTVKMYVDNKLMNTTDWNVLKEEEVQLKEKIKVTWENVEQVNEKIGFATSYYYKQVRQGKVISFRDYSFKGIKPGYCEWIDKNINIYFLITYEIITPTKKEIIKWWDKEKMNQYLKERGLTINGK